MRVAGRFLFGGFLALTAACGSDATQPGALVITLNGPPPSLTTSTTLAISGQVTRTPPAPDQDIVVTVTGGASPISDTAAVDGSFAFNVGLTANAQNNLSVTASDLAGSTATPVGVAVRHDALPPGLASMTPAAEADGVSPATIQVVFSESVVPGSVTASLTSYGTGVPGVAALSGDSLTLTFTPSAALVSNAVHVLTILNARDAAGNTALSVGGCFVTGGAPAQGADGSADFFVTDPPPPTSLVPVDVLGVRFASSGSTLYGAVRFSGPRSLTASAGNNVSAFIDIDDDQDGGTGFVTLKDTIFSGLLPSSGAGAELVIEFGTFLPGALGGMVAQYTAQDSVQFLEEFAPAACGSVVGFAVPLSVVGGDGVFDAVGYFDAFDAGSGASFIDPAPDSLVYGVSLTATAGMASSTAGGPGRPVFGVPRRARPSATRR